MTQRNRERRPARRAAPKQPRHRILVVCEGQVTEPSYFFAFRDWCRNPRVEVSIPKEHGTPRTLVELALAIKRAAEARAHAERDENLAFDEVWCAYDVDEHPKLNDARQLAQAHGIELAISNPCFELWLLLHFRESPGARHRHDVQALLATFLPGYEKHPDMALVLHGYEKAKERAERLDKDAADMGEAGRNPTATVHLLTESIRGVGQGAA